MQEHQQQWGRPTGSASPHDPSEPLTTLTRPQDVTTHLFNFAPRPEASTSTFTQDMSSSGIGMTPAAVGGYSNMTSIGPTSSQVESPVVPNLGNISTRGRPKSKAAKPKPQGLGTERKARKKVAKACLACQKSHLTCDEQRPCTRCVKKGMADKCVEGVRKKAKYLMEGDERAAALAPLRPSQPSSIHSISPRSQSHNLPSMPSLPVSAENPLHLSNDVWLANTTPREAPPSNMGLPPSFSLEQASDVWNGGQNVDIASGGFGGIPGTTANNEYQMLDAMFASLSPTYAGISDPLEEAGRQLAVGAGSSLDLASNPVPNPSFDQAWVNPSPSQSSPAFNPAPSVLTGISRSTFSEVPANQWNGWPDAPGQVMLDGSGGSVDLGQIRGPGAGNNIESRLRRGKGASPSEVYNTVVRPYDYTQGYHILMDYMTKNFETPDVLRVVRSLASFRPSLIALQMPMSEEDEIFLERSFQRTLIELEKLISYSASPTAVWRRTGEVCYASPEFCKLVKRCDLDLLGKKTYIYELFAKPSVVSYWENFSVHAFENTTQNFFQPVLLDIECKGQGDLECTCCFTIRRDVFDLPSVVIGQFLPVFHQ
ncbi:uncharacterized protein L203_104721 [Cryptococcus depauperatus CBS 7841]|uniref:Transcription activator of gluconeogenesis ERT1 n=1 Tax=Cryptococcus depauperatus CBS 7841 TaxID=1295531 RepID=A0AAJ8JVZ5_9TREE